MEKLKVAKLRFKEFSGEWEEKKLGEIANIYDGTHQTPTYTESGVKFVSVENINSIETTEKYISEEAFKNDFKIKPQTEDILMTRITAGIIGATAIVKNDNPLGYYVSLALIRKKIMIDTFFLDYSLNTNFFKNELHKRIIHVAFPKKINLGDMNDCVIRYSNDTSEQQKIADFLSNVDEKIEKLTKKKELLEQYKKGVMQKIFSQEIRFKDNNGNDFPEWEEKELGDCLDYIQPTNYIVKSTEYDNKYDIPVLTAGKSFILGYTNEEFGIFENPLPVIIFDDFTTSSHFVDFRFKVKSSAMKILTIKGDNNIKYIYEAMKDVKYIVGGHERHWISKYSFLIIQIPSLDEQQKIADFISALDKKIDIVDKELGQVQEFKKGLLQQMFV